MMDERVGLKQSGRREEKDKAGHGGHHIGLEDRKNMVDHVNLNHTKQQTRQQRKRCYIPSRDEENARKAHGEGEKNC